MRRKNAFIQKLINVPLWVKTIGVVVIPLLLVTFAIVLYIRSAILSTLLVQDMVGAVAKTPGLLTQQLITAAVIAMVIGVILAYGLSRLLIYPLHQTLNVIREIEAGNVDARVPIWANDEIGQVQMAFNQMTAQLEQANGQLKELNQRLLAVNNLAQEVSLSQNTEAVLDVALDYAISLLKSDIATFFHVDGSAENVKLITHRGEVPADFLDIIRTQKLDSTPMQYVISTNETLFINGLESKEHLSSEIKALLMRFGIDHVAFTPIQISGKTLGSFNLARRTGNPFDQDDLTILESIGKLIGFGLTNVQLLDGLKHKEVELRRALLRSVELQEEERKRLARELHDETSQALTSILIRLRLLQDEQDLETINDRINGMRYLTAQTIEELRRIAMDLRPAMLDSLGIVPALRWLIQRTEELTGIAIGFTAPAEGERFSAEIELTLYRISQEAITNAIRHGEASKIEVILERGPYAIWLVVQDNGKGFDPQIFDPGLGMVGIRERVELVNGLFSIETSPGSGTRLWVEVRV